MTLKLSRRNFVLSAAATVTAMSLAKPSVSAQDDAYQPYVGYVAAGIAHEIFENPKTFPGNDCANFMSHVMWKAGLPKGDRWTDLSTDMSLLADPDLIPGPTRAAAVAADFVDYQISAGYADLYRIDWSDNTASGAQLGDVIAYAWTGSGHIDHVGMVGTTNGDGYPEIIEHSEDNRRRYWSWSISKDNWIEYAYPGSSAYLVRMYNGPRF